VPRALLRAFSVNGLVDIYEVDTGRLFSTAPENAGVEAGYYDVDVGGQALSAEAWLAGVEGRAAPLLSKITADPTTIAALSAEEENDLARFICAQDFRTPAFRELDARIGQQMVGHVKEFGRRWLETQFAPKEAEDIWNAWKGKPDEWFLHEEKPHQASRSVAGILSEVQGFANILLAMPWRVGHVTVPPGIYLGDNPVVRRELTALPRAGYCEHTYYLPLSAGVLFSAGPHLSGSRRGPRRAIDFSPWETSVARHLTTTSASRHVFGRGPYVTRECAHACLDKITEEDWRLTVRTRRPNWGFAGYRLRTPTD
jgi:hypothetical protein